MREAVSVGGRLHFKLRVSGVPPTLLARAGEVVQ